jgi:import inner membrane translocase subunit TIM9
VRDTGLLGELRGNASVFSLVASFKRMQDPSKTVPPHAKVEYDAYVASQHRRDSLLMFNRLLESCFDSCVEKFHSKNLAEKEKDCIRNCADRNMKTTQRVGFRYSELNFLKVRNPAPLFPLPKMLPNTS